MKISHSTFFQNITAICCMWWKILIYTSTQHYVYSSQRIIFLGLLYSCWMDRQPVSKRVNYQHMLHKIPEVWSPHTKYYLEISSHWVDDSFRCTVLPFPPPITLTISLGIIKTGEHSTPIAHGDKWIWHAGYMATPLHTAPRAFFGT